MVNFKNHTKELLIQDYLHKRCRAEDKLPHLIHKYFEALQWIKAEMVVETCWSLGNTSWQMKASPPRGFFFQW